MDYIGSEQRLCGTRDQIGQENMTEDFNRLSPERAYFMKTW